MNKAEKLVQRMCHKSFLSLWSYANPQGKKKGKELCDVLVVCGRDVVIFSVKEIGASQSGDESVDWQRWHKHAVEQSCDQIYGAERWLKSAKHVIRNDGTSGLSLPNLEERRIHRIAVALGSKGRFPIEYGDLGHGFVHVFDETSLEIILRELDTISDFVAYLKAKEDYCEKVMPILEGEENLLALYLQNGKAFPEDTDVLFLGNDLWTKFADSDQYKKKKAADKPSYIWDSLIEAFSSAIHTGDLEFGSNLNESEKALRTMAVENRMFRRILGKAFAEFLEDAKANKVRAQRLRSPSGVVYVFLAHPHGEQREIRVTELRLRCFVARGLTPEADTAIGIATEQPSGASGSSLDLVCLFKRKWTDADQIQLERIQNDLGYFANSVITKSSEDEYPA